MDDVEARRKHNATYCLYRGVYVTFVFPIE